MKRLNNDWRGEGEWGFTCFLKCTTMYVHESICDPLYRHAYHDYPEVTRLWSHDHMTPQRFCITLVTDCFHALSCYTLLPWLGQRSSFWATNPGFDSPVDPGRAFCYGVCISNPPPPFMSECPVQKRPKNMHVRPIKDANIIIHNCGVTCVMKDRLSLWMWPTSAKQDVRGLINKCVNFTADYLKSLI